MSSRTTPTNPLIPLHYPSRILMTLLFLASGTSKLTSISTTQAYMEAYGVPGMLIYPAAVFEIVGGVMLLLDRRVAHLGWLLSGWCLLTGVIFHREWTDQTQLVMFLKNLVMAGGFLVLVERGAWRV